ncbi:MAG: VCBS repeat-containing protein [Candidatus Aenigmarchaeota archaeon]|nr:VCBS repeat-containing protein [Candidatus Aenigmarchaeota archaeon]
MRGIIAITGLLLVLLSSFVNANAQPYLFENHTWQENLIGAEFVSSAWGDIDNDGDLDLALTGCTYYGGSGCTSFIAKMYINNGTSLVEDYVWGGNMTPINYGSISWGDIDNDGDLDLISIGCSDGGGTVGVCGDFGYQTFVYINNGTSLVEDYVWGGNLEKIWKGSAVLGDINNDGRLDAVLTGQSASGKISNVYINNGTSLVEDSVWGDALTSLYESSAILGDVNNDCNIDLILCGDEGISNEITEVYLNNGTNFIESSTWQQNLLGVDWCSLSSADYDNDGDLDLALIGHTTQDNQRIYRNTGENFTEIQKEIGDLVGIFEGSMSFGDYDNDGYLDLIATGNEGYTTLYLFNSSRNKFTQSVEDPETSILNLEKGSSISFVDIDNDQDLDLSIFGYLEPVDQQARIYVNNISSSNTLPTEPISDFIDEYNNSLLNLSWGGGLDAETATPGLYYNLRVGTCSGCHNIVSGVYGGSSNPTAGYFGNMMQRKSFTLKRSFDPGTTIYWAVQTIDAGLAKSEWSEEQVYVIHGNESNCTPSWSCISWGACQPTDIQTCISWTDANSCNESYNGSSTRSCTYDDGGSGGGSSGGSSFVSPVTREYTFNAINKGVLASKNISGGITVRLAVRNNVTNVDIKAHMTAEKPASIAKDVSGKVVYRYMEITSSGINDSDIEEATIEFNITSEWLSDNKIVPESVTLLRYHENDWQELQTEMTSHDDHFYYYSASTPGFSYFAITGEEITEDADATGNANPSLLCDPGSRRCSGSELQECNMLGTVWIAKELCENGCDPQTRTFIQSPSDIPWQYVIALLAAAVVIAVFLLRKGSKPKTLEDALKGVPNR